MGDEGLEPTRLKQRVLQITGISAGPKAGPNLSLGELTCRLIERWEELDAFSKDEIQRMLE